MLFDSRLPPTLVYLLLISLANAAVAQQPQSDDDDEYTIGGGSSGKKNLTWEIAVIAVVVLVICTVAGIAIRSRIKKRRQRLLDEDDLLDTSRASLPRGADLESGRGNGSGSRAYVPSTSKSGHHGEQPDLRATDWASSVTLTSAPSPTLSALSAEKKTSAGSSTPPRRASPPALPYGLRQPPRAHSPIREKH